MDLATNTAGLVVGIRDPRPLTFPQIPDEALTYLLYLLREVQLTGTLLDNLYLASVGLVGSNGVRARSGHHHGIARSGLR
jgi:hypothetical protein